MALLPPDTTESGLPTGAATNGFSVIPKPVHGIRPPGDTSIGAPQPRMVPAYVAKAMQKQNERLEKENALVPEPTRSTGTQATGEVATTRGVPAAAPAPTTPLVHTVASPITAEQQATYDQDQAAVKAASDAAAAKTAADEKAKTSAAATVVKSASDVQAAEEEAYRKAHPQTYTPTTDVTVTPPASGVTPPAATDAPEVVKAKTEAEQTFADLMETAKSWMNAKEDPASKLAFSKAIIQSSLVNQEAMNATKAAIANNPALAGQPAGDALLALRAGQLGMQVADLKGTLAIAEQRAISDLNKNGFDALQKLNEIRKTDDEKNLTSYGSVLDEMIKGGANDTTLENFFNNNIKPLLPGGGAGLTLDMFRNKATRANLLQGTRNETQRLFREALASKQDLTTIQQLISAGWTPEQLTAIGNDWAKGKTLEDINQGLVDAGFEPVDDLAELIGNEDLLGQAALINQNKTEIEQSPFEDDVDDTLQNLTAAGYDLTPELEQQVRAYLVQQSLPGADLTDVPPWKDDATAYLWDSWPLPGKSDFGNGTIEETPATASIYARNSAIDNLWEQYLSKNTDAEKRLTRKDWYADLVKNNPGVADGSLDANAIKNIKTTTTIPKIDPGDRTLAAAEGARLVNAAPKFTDIDWTDPNVVEFVTQLSNVVPSVINKTWVNANLGKTVKIDGKIYKVKKLYNIGGGEKNDGVWLERQDGTQVYMDRNGRTEDFATDRYI